MGFLSSWWFFFVVQVQPWLMLVKNKTMPNKAKMNPDKMRNWTTQGWTEKLVLDKVIRQSEIYYGNITYTVGKQMKQTKSQKTYRSLRLGLKAAGPTKGPHYPSIGRWTPFQAQSSYKTGGRESHSSLHPILISAILIHLYWNTLAKQKLHQLYSWRSCCFLYGSYLSLEIPKSSRT